MTVDPLTSTHKATYLSKTYWFCCAGCQSSFEQDAERYLRPIEAL
jgi:Cu+-exporting ATPase